MNLQLINKNTKEVLFSNVTIAETFIQRLCGLMFRSSISNDTTFVFYRTSAIHTFFMRFPIDIIFLDRDMKVVDICKLVKPWRMRVCPGSKAVIECSGNVTGKKGLKEGDKLSVLSCAC